MSKAKNENKKTNPKSEKKPKEVIKKAGEKNRNKKNKQMLKIAKALEAGLEETATPAPVLAEVSDSVEATSKMEVQDDAPHAVEPEVKNDAPGPDLVKQLKKEKNKLKKKLAKAAEKQKQKPKTSESIAGPGKTVFVGNVPCNTKRVQLSKLFAKCGNIVTIRFRTANGKVIFKHKMRKESGALIAYVAFDSSEAASKALELNGTILKGQLLRVQKSEKTHETSNPKNTVFVGNLKYSATDDSLHQIFSSCGEIEYVRTMHSPEKEGCVGTAFVCFKSPDAVGLALELKGTMLDERPIHVERYAITKLGAKKKRITENKAPQQGKSKGGKPLKKAGQNHNGKQAEDEKKKKSEFRGVKSGKSIKKPKKKIPSQLKRLANKIAPRD